jgi:hypothetical protein
VIRKGARSSAHPSPSRYSTDLSQGQHNWGRARPCEAGNFLRDPFTLHPCYSSARSKNSSCSVRHRTYTTLQWGYIRLQEFLPLMLVIAFGGGPMTNILLYNLRSTNPHSLAVLMAASSLVFWSAYNPVRPRDRSLKETESNAAFTSAHWMPLHFSSADCDGGQPLPKETSNARPASQRLTRS